MSLAETLKFEVAYCHYRNNDDDKSDDYLDTDAQPGLNHIVLRPRSSTSSSSLRSVRLFAETKRGRVRASVVKRTFYDHRDCAACGLGQGYGHQGELLADLQHWGLGSRRRGPYQR